MPDPGPIHFVAHFTVHDPIVYRQYEKGFFPILRAYGGRLITYDDNPVVLEGERIEGRTVIIGFDSEDACFIWWNSPEYIELAKFRQAATTTHSIAIVHAPPAR